MQPRKAGAKGGCAGGDIGRAVRSQSLGDQVGQRVGVSRGHAAPHEFGRAHPQAIQVTLDLRNGQANAAGEEPGLTERLRGSLATAERPGMYGELM